MEFELSANLPWFENRQRLVKASASLAANRLSRNYWIITHKYGNGYFDVQKESALIYNFSSSTGQLSAGSSSNDDITKYSYVLCILPGARYLDVGDVVKLGFYFHSLKRPYIKQIIRSHMGKEPLNPSALVLSGSWLQYRGLHGLARMNEGTMPDFTALSSTLWTPPEGQIIGVPLGILVTEESVWVAYGVRNEANTAWVSVDLAQITAVNTATYYTASYSSTAGSLGGFDGMWMSENADLLFAWIFGTLTLFRKRFLLWEAVTIATPTRGALAAFNISDDGVLCQGIFTRTKPEATLSEGTLAGTYSFTSQEEVNGGDVEGWNLNIAGTSIPQAWAKNPITDLWGSDYVLTTTNVGGKLPEVGDGFVVATTARPKMSNSNTLYEKALAVNESSLPGAPPYDADGAAQWSTVVYGKLTCLAKTTGEVLWSYLVTAEAGSPVADSGLYDPMEAFCALFNFGEFVEGSDTISPIYGGILNADEILHSLDTGGDGIGTSSWGTYPVPLGDFTGPKYGYFRAASVVFLPAATRNTTQPTQLAEGVFRNSDAFICWPQNLEQQDGTLIETSPEVVSDGTNVYCAYLKPKNTFIGGNPGLGMGPFYPGLSYGWSGVFSGRLATYTAILYDEEDEAYGREFTIKLARSVNHLCTRHVAKVRDGALLWEADISQMKTMSFRWIDNEAVDPVTTDGTIYGGDSLQTHPLGDNVWRIVPYKRFVFVLVDNHVLGPNFQPTVELLILSNETGQLLHTVSLLHSQATLSAPIYEQLETTDYFVYEGSRDFILSEVASSVAHVKVNDVEVGYTITSNDPTTTIRLDNEYELDDSVEIRYFYNGNITVLEGDYVYDISTNLEIRATGQDNAEVCTVFTQQTNRETLSTLDRMVQVEMKVEPTESPDLVTANVSAGGIAPISVSGGNAYFVGFDTGWNVQII